MNHVMLPTTSRRRHPRLLTASSLVVLLLLRAIYSWTVANHGSWSSSSRKDGDSLSTTLHEPLTSRNRPLDSPPPPPLPLSPSSNNDHNHNHTTVQLCMNNSGHPRCCTPSHCAVVRRSTLYSDCCHNRPFWNATLPEQVQAEQKTGHPISELTRTIPILVTATPRSGTVFLQTLLRKFGVVATTDMQTPRQEKAEVVVSWIHGRRDDQYFGNGKLFGSRFHHVFHWVRDPLQCLTSIAFTEPLDETPYNTEGRQSYLTFLRRHIYLTDKHEILRQQQQQQQHQQQSSSRGGGDAHSFFLIYRAIEFFTQWHRFLLDLNLPRLSLEDVTLHGNLTGLHAIWTALGRSPPNPTEMQRWIQSLRRRRRLSSTIPPHHHTNSRTHRAILKWEELCHVSPALTHDLLNVSHALGYYLDQVHHVCDGLID